MEEKLRVLVVDDMEVIVKSIKNYLIKDESIEIIGTANNGKEEYEKILELKPDIVITDNQMPEKNGIDVIEEINELEIDNKPDFILVTGDRNIELSKKANELGIFRILNKPIEERDILNAIIQYKEDKKLSENNEIVVRNQFKKETLLEKLKKLFNRWR